MEYAIIRYGGRQFKIKTGDKFELTRQSDTNLDVLLYFDGNNYTIGMPTVSDISVELKKIVDTKDKKVRVARFKSKSRYRKVKGHRQPISVFEVVGIVKAQAVKKDDKSNEVKSLDNTIEAVKTKKSGKVANLETTKKDTSTVKDEPKKRGRPKKKE